MNLLTLVESKSFVALQFDQLWWLHQSLICFWAPVPGVTVNIYGEKNLDYKLKPFYNCS